MEAGRGRPEPRLPARSYPATPHESAAYIAALERLLDGATRTLDGCLIPLHRPPRYQVWVGPPVSRQIGAHRLVWLCLVGPLPADGLPVSRTCRNYETCIEPLHLWVA